MPTDIKKSAIALLISLISTFIAVYFDGLEFEQIGFDDPWILGTNAIWALVVAWIIWDLLKGKGIKLTLVLVGLIMLAALIWDVFEFGFNTAQIFYTVEIIMFVVAYYFVTTPQSKAWYSAMSLSPEQEQASP